MIPYTVYDKTGRILRSGFCQPDCAKYQAGDQFVIEEKSNDQTDYVLKKKVTPRPLMQIEASASSVEADGLTEVVITGAPPGAVVKVSGPVSAEGQVEDQPIVLTFAQSGLYTVRIDAFPYKEEEVTIHAT